MFKKIFQIPVIIVLRIVSVFLPKKKELWLFSSWGGRRFIDNPKHFFEYINSTKEEIRPVWLCKNYKLYLELRSKKIECVYYLSLRGVFYQLTAGVIFYAHSISWDFLIYAIGPGTKCVQLWHGIPMKKIGGDDEVYEKDQGRLCKIIKRIYKLVLFLKQDDIWIANSNYDADIYKRAYGIEESKIKILGSPRNDRLFKQKKARRCIYMPTYRGGEGTEFKFLSDYGLDFDEFDRKLRDMDVYLDIKLHPVQLISPVDAEKIKACQRINFLKGDCSDIYDFLGSYDILVSDFSSVVFDYLLLDRPIIMAAFEKQSYLENDRELYFDYEDIFIHNIIQEWSGVITAIESHFTGGSLVVPDSTLKEMFHKYDDGISCERLYDTVERMLDK